MQKKYTYIFIIIVLVILGIAGWFVYQYLFNKQEASVTVENPETINRPPHSSNNTQATTTQSSNSNKKDQFSSGPAPIIRQISNEPIAGAVIFSGGKNKPELIHFIDRATGHVFETSVDQTDTSLVSGTRIPKVYEAYWLNSGKTAYLRYLDADNETIETYTANLVPTKNYVATTTLDVTYSPQQLNGSFLTQDIESIAINNDRPGIFYITKGYKNATGIVARTDGTAKRNIFNSPLVEWLVSWPKSNVIALTNKPSYLSPGSLYFLNPDSGALSPVISNKIGLTTLVSSDASKVLYSETDQTGLATFLLDVAGGSISSFPLATLPEKCVWASKNTITYCAVPKTLNYNALPDSWYQGQIQFDDEIWKINVVNRAFDRIANNFSGQNIDAINLSVDPQEKYLIFTNKRDGILWGIDLSRIASTTSLL